MLRLSRLFIFFPSSLLPPLLSSCGMVPVASNNMNWGGVLNWRPIFIDDNFD
ncbi:hypothetical protein BJ684DRAFT_22204 [Piptocephalis cylindrospora]|uniref:Uncharacterized protein n=1 Tax=Piptocephalis cylindrospora TaxID=1907219 RepID=A0A4P9XXW2_9FUNG|nr:hypothetical protein BJ684DRAFT_22204 [Piptocephalis cylindrospora]|eukprot:RKP11245.1 hypothetical protein BJ684DRAFT_22204 [Piptocephalis cylindrospora]